MVVYFMNSKKQFQFCCKYRVIMRFLKFNINYPEGVRCDGTCSQSQSERLKREDYEFEATLTKSIP